MSSPFKIHSVYPKIQSTSLEDIPVSDTEELSERDIKKILDFIEYSDNKEYPDSKDYSLSDSDLLKRLSKDLNKEVPWFVNLVEMNEKKINNLKLVEKECDILEISLANLKVEYDEIMHLRKFNLEDQLNFLNSDFNDAQFETQHISLLNQAYAFLNQEPVNKNILNMFRFVKQSKNYDLVVEKQDLINQISNFKSNRVLSLIFMDLIHQSVLKIEDIERKYLLDKVVILKIVYGLTNNGVVSFDNERGIIQLRK